MSRRTRVPSLVALSALAFGLAGGCGGGGGGSVGSDEVPRYHATFLADDVRLETDPYPGEIPSLRPRIAADGASVFVVWTDPRYVKSSVFLRHSSDGGATWNPFDVRVERKAPRTSDSTVPRFAVVGEAVFVVWEDYRDGDGDVYFNRSLDGGATWLPADRRLDTDEPGASASLTPEIATDGTHVFVVWSDYRSLRGDIFVNRSEDGGLTWQASDRRLDTDVPGAAASVMPEIALSGGHVVVVWADGRVQFTDIRSNRSDDFGATWLSKDVRLDSDAEGVSPSANPRIAAEGSTFVVVWEDGRSGDSDIRANRSLDGGAHWLAHDVRLDTDYPGYGPSLAPAVAISGGERVRRVAGRSRRLPRTSASTVRSTAARPGARGTSASTRGPRASRPRRRWTSPRRARTSSSSGRTAAMGTPTSACRRRSTAGGSSCRTTCGSTRTRRGARRRSSRASRSRGRACSSSGRTSATASPTSGSTARDECYAGVESPPGPASFDRRPSSTVATIIARPTR